MMSEDIKAKIRKAHKVYTNQDGVQMCEMQFSEYLKMEQTLTKLEQQAKELKELKQTNFIVKENIDGILSRMITFDEVSDLTLSYVEDIQDELDKLAGEEDE